MDGQTGILVEPRDLLAYGRAVRALLDDERTAHEMGRAGHEHVAHEFLGDRHLEQWAQLLEQLT